jgi:hypothetical protein
MTIGERIKDCIRHLVFGMLGFILILVFINTGCTVSKNERKKDVSDSKVVGVMANEDMREEISNLKVEVRELKAKNKENSKKMEDLSLSVDILDKKDNCYLCMVLSLICKIQGKEVPASVKDVCFNELNDILKKYSELTGEKAETEKFLKLFDELFNK